MPRVTSTQLDRLITAFDDTNNDHAIVVPIFPAQARQPGRTRPRLLRRRRHAHQRCRAHSLIERNPSHVQIVQIVELEDAAILVDVDTPERLAELRDEPPST